MIALLDYGAGNVGSVLKALRYLDHDGVAVDRPEGLAQAGKIILPGQGHFATVMKGLNDRGMLDVLRQEIAGGKPFLGICLGLQVLYEGSAEAPGVSGLGLLPGQVTRFQGVFKVPHVGWSQIDVKSGEGIFKGVPSGSFFYFCHSYYGPVAPQSSALTEYGQTFSSGIEFKNVKAVQFHPEKSGEVGLRVLRNFLES
jgi:imidazole glycerol phosphate synthase glutamine amidotransferase subunit